jgi:hypothetical protein
VAKDFVLFVIIYPDGGRAARYSLFQEPNNPEVCWTLCITKFAGAESS